MFIPKFHLEAISTFSTFETAIFLPLALMLHSMTILHATILYTKFKFSLVSLASSNVWYHATTLVTGHRGRAGQTRCQRNTGTVLTVASHQYPADDSVDTADSGQGGRAGESGHGRRGHRGQQ